MPQSLDQCSVDISVTGLAYKGFRAFSQLPGQGLGLDACCLDDLRRLRVSFQSRNDVMRVLEQADSQVAVVIYVGKPRGVGNQGRYPVYGLVHVQAVGHVDMFFTGLEIGFHNQRKQPAETLLGLVQDRCRDRLFSRDIESTISSTTEGLLERIFLPTWTCSPQ